MPSRGAGRAAGRARAGCAGAARLPARDGVLDAHQAHRRGPGRRGAAARRADGSARTPHASVPDGKLARARRPATKAERAGDGTPQAAVAADQRRSCKSLPVDRSQVRDRHRPRQRSRPGSRRRTPPAASPSTPRPPASIRCRPSFVGFSLGRRARAGLLRAARPPRRDGSLRFRRRAIAKQIPVGEALAVLKPLLEDPSVLKIGQNIKYDCLVLGPARHRARADRRHHAACPTRSTAGKGQHGMDDAGRAPPRPHLHAVQAGARRTRRAPRSRTRPSRRCRSTRRPSTPPRTPTSRCGCGCC